jgi:nicotinamidase-related amidase
VCEAKLPTALIVVDVTIPWVSGTGSIPRSAMATPVARAISPRKRTGIAVFFIVFLLQLGISNTVHQLWLILTASLRLFES